MCLRFVAADFTRGFTDWPDAQFDGVVSAYHTPHCARIQPAQLARGLADTVERLGVDIYEDSPVTAIKPHLRGDASDGPGRGSDDYAIENRYRCAPGEHECWTPTCSGDLDPPDLAPVGAHLPRLR